ncbi:hypothetical protein EMCRGX_G001464 [Ephydatia muelleri]
MYDKLVYDARIENCFILFASEKQQRAVVAADPSAHPTTLVPAADPSAHTTTMVPATDPSAHLTTMVPVADPSAHPTTMMPAANLSAYPTTMQKSTATILDQNPSGTILDQPTATLLDQPTATILDQPTATILDHNLSATILDQHTTTCNIRPEPTATVLDTFKYGKDSVRSRIMVLSVFLFLATSTRVTSNTKMIPRCFFCIFNIFQNVPSIEKKGVPANVKFLEELFTCPE